MTINKVSKVNQQINFGQGIVQVQAPEAEEAVERTEATPKSDQTDEKASETNTTTNNAANTPSPVLNGDVRLKFIVDSKTNDVTVLVLDKASRQIIRTIPTDELNNLTQGDLVTIFA